MAESPTDRWGPHLRSAAWRTDGGERCLAWFVRLTVRRPPGNQCNVWRTAPVSVSSRLPQRAQHDSGRTRYRGPTRVRVARGAGRCHQAGRSEPERSDLPPGGGSVAPHHRAPAFPRDRGPTLERAAPPARANEVDVLLDRLARAAGARRAVSKPGWSAQRSPSRILTVPGQQPHLGLAQRARARDEAHSTGREVLTAVRDGGIHPAASSLRVRSSLSPSDRASALSPPFSALRRSPRS